MSDCCPSTKDSKEVNKGSGCSPVEPSASSCCPSDDNKPSFDYLLYGSLSVVVIGYFAYFLGLVPDSLHHFGHGIFELTNTIWWGLALGILFAGLLEYVPRELVISVIGKGDSFVGIVRATFAGVLLDLCSHGILFIGMKLYNRGASAGQVMAFLLASPWNSFSLTLILIALIGLPLTLLFIVLSMVIGIITGMIFAHFVKTGVLPENPNKVDMPENYQAAKEFKKLLSQLSLSPRGIMNVVGQGLSGSKMVLRWALFGIVLASLIRGFMDADTFSQYFGATFLGLMLTLLAATIIEVCSEGSAPIAGDLVNRAGASGNGFTFLMAGVATDYTEIMSIKDTMKSWKLALFLPLISLPQVVFMGWLINNYW